MSKVVKYCDECGSSNEDGRLMDFYGYGKGERRVCDPCVDKACRDNAPRVAVMPARPEGYYHSPIGSFD